MGKEWEDEKRDNVSDVGVWEHRPACSGFSSWLQWNPNTNQSILITFWWGGLDASIHPSFFRRFLGPFTWQQAKQDSPDVPLSSSVFQLLLGDPEVFPSQMRYVIYPACSGSTLRSLTSWTSIRRHPRRHPDQMLKPPQPAPFYVTEQRLYCELRPDIWAPYPISKGELRRPACNCYHIRPVTTQSSWSWVSVCT